MDFMKVIDQTVREIKREVNLKVLKVPEIEQKVLDATDNEPWGPHGTALAEIAQATKKLTECQMVMNVLWTRLGETGKDWRYVYKALAVIEYLVANGSERAIDDIIEHTFQISSLAGFEYVEPNGKDMGINVRKKAETIVSLLNDKEKIQEVRNKAAANRDKYFGLSSSGITYKSGSASFGSSNFESRNRSGGFSGTNDSDSFNDKDKDEDRFGEEKFEEFVPKSRRGLSSERKKVSATASSESNDQELPSSHSSKPPAKINISDGYNAVPQKSSRAPSNNQLDDDDDDDFDPRGTSKSKGAARTSQVDLFGQSLVGDLMDAPTPSETAFVDKNSSDVDLFADAAYVSAGGSSQIQPTVDLFASEPASSAAVEFLAVPAAGVQQETKPTHMGSSNVNSIDPFAAVPLNKFDESDLFGAFTSHADSSSPEPIQNPANSGSTNDMSNKSLSETNASLKKDTFQVKSGIWADSLSRGLIDLNISAPKKVSLADVGIVGGLSDGLEEKQKGPPQATYYMGRAMGAGSGLGRTGVTTSTALSGENIFSDFSSQQYQFGGFQK
ncbi:hypothetical protein Nepgr_012630 [Nepenthes gracilis]|uniref:ENTH domain-containing protein n=1 Tax=Nepenthes gracilis TaxID=150966 RepID=A0AAD3SHM2_NEPGR|nr:hypothetical protein Nepgr_012630 [Nepenthes gracilis]